MEQNVMLSLRLSSREYARVKRAASEGNVAVSEYVRRTLMRSIDGDNMETEIRTTRVYARLVHEDVQFVKKILVRLIAQPLNTQKFLSDEEIAAFVQQLVGEKELISDRYFNEARLKGGIK